MFVVSLDSSLSVCRDKLLFVTVLGTAKPSTLGAENLLVFGTRKPLETGLESKLDEIDREPVLFGPGSADN